MVVRSLSHEADDLAAKTRLAGLRVGHDAGRRGNDGDAETPEDLRQRVLAAVHAKARTADALEALDDRLAFVVLERDLERRLAVGVRHLRVGDVALVLQELRERLLHAGGRHRHGTLARGLRIADARKHVGDGISHAHVSIPGIDIRCKAGFEIRDSGFVSSGLLPSRISNPESRLLLPARFPQARDVTTHGGFTKLVTAEAELAVDTARAAGQRAAIALARRARVARKLLQLDRRSQLVVVGRRRAGDDFLELHTLRAVTLD